MNLRSCFALAFAGWVHVAAQEVAWTYTPRAGHVDVSPVAGDVDGDADRQAEVVVGTTGGEVVALQASGQVLWRQATRDAVCIPPTIADATGDGSPDVLAANRLGDVVCLDGRSGEVIWTTTLPSPPQWGASCLAVGDLRGDGAAAVVIGTREGSVVCLAGESGEREWVAAGEWGTVFSPALADLDGDHRAEVLVGTEKVSLICLDAAGRERWRRSEGAGGSPFVWQAGAKRARIVCGMGRRLHALDAAGQTLWSHPMKRELDSAIAIADTDADGEPEVYAVDLSGHVVSLTWDGRLRWEAEVGERSRRSPAIVDIDGDGKPEILIAGYSRALDVFEASGRLKSHLPLPGPSNGTPTPIALGDRLAVVVPVAGAPLQALRWPQSERGARVLWGGCRYDAAHTGSVPPPEPASPVQLAIELQPLPKGRARAEVIVRNPARHALSLQTEVMTDDGAPVSRRLDFAAAEFRRAFSLALPSGPGPARLRFTCRVRDGATTVARCSRTLQLHELAPELARLGDTVQRTEARLPRLLDARGVEERTVVLAGKLAALRERLAGSIPLTERERLAARRAWSGLAGEAEALDRLTTLGLEAAAAGSTVRVGAGNPWAPFGGMEELGERRVASTNLAVFAFRDETESAVLNVFNLSSQARTFRVELEPLTPVATGAVAVAAVPARMAVGMFEVLAVPTERCDLQADALAPLGVASVLHVPPWGARQLWFNVDARVLGAGDWRGRVRLRSLEVVPVEVGATLAVTVAATRLPARQRLHQCGWGYVHALMLKDHPAEALADQVTHGTDVFVGLHFPQARFDADGNLVGEIDFREHDAYVRQHAPHGTILFCGYPGALQGPAAEGTAARDRASVAWLRAWVKHLAELGIGYDGFALYPVDEPGLSQGLVSAYLRQAKLAREADPRIRMYTDPVGGITVEELKEMLPYVDIWCPNRAGLVLDPNNRAKLEIIKGSGKAVWMYECADNAKHQPPLGYYRGQAWLAWSHQMTGIGFWSYCTSADDPWFVPQQRYDYLLVYPGQGVVSSKRWEAVRDGIEDYALLDALRERLAAAGGSAPAERVASARRLLGEQANRIAGFCSVDDDRRPITAGERRRIEDERWDQLQQIRRELARLLSAF